VQPKFVIESTDFISLLLPVGKMAFLGEIMKKYYKPVIVHNVDCDGCSDRLGRPTKSVFVKRTMILRVSMKYRFDSV